MDRLIAHFKNPRPGPQELLYPEILNELLALQEDDPFVDFRIQHDGYFYGCNVFHLYYDGIISDREQIERWAKILHTEGTFVFAEFNAYIAIRQSRSGVINVINPHTKKDYFTKQQREDHINAQDLDICSIITLIKQRGFEFYAHRENHRIDVVIRRTLNECAEKRSMTLENIQFGPTPTTDDLSEPQRAVIEHVNTHNVTITTGGAGTGKTTIIIELIRSHLANPRCGLWILTPTHMAANNIRMRLLTTFSVDEMKKIFIGTINEFGYKHKHPSGALIIFEESSMYDNVLGRIIEHNQGNYYDCKYLFIGDPKQLPPPSRNSIYQWIIDNHKKHHVHLSHNYRSGDIIIKNSERIGVFEQCGKVIFNTSENFMIDAAATIQQLKIERHYNDVDPDQVMFITHRNIDVLAVNRYLRDHYFRSRGIEHNSDVLSESRTHNVYHGNKMIGAWEWRVGDKARCKENRPTIFNGSICVVRGFEGDSIVVEYNGKLIVISSRRLWPAYCITVHNSQGQEWERVVFCDLSNRPLQAALLYVGITRGKKQVAIARITDSPAVTEFDLEQWCAPVEQNEA